MNIRKLSGASLGFGLFLIFIAIIWTLQLYADVVRQLMGKGVQIKHAIACLYSLGTPCGVPPDKAPVIGFDSAAPYLFWIGLILFVVSVVVLLMVRPAPSANGTRSSAMQEMLILVDKISTWVGYCFAWCILLLTFATCYEVFSRYVLGRPTTWAYDASYILYGTLFIMAGAYALCRNGHVRGDFLYRSWRPKTQAGMDLLLYFLFFFPGMLAFVYSGYNYAAASWAVHEHSAYSPAGPPIYHFKTLIPITGVLMLMQGIAEVVRCIICLKIGRWPQRLHDVEELEKVILEEHAHQAKGAAR
jgi:TRAP-type mannitol/chloroaromatic compound transport system permease small subunit